MNSAASPMTRLFGCIGTTLSHPELCNYWIGISAAIIRRWMLKVAIGWLTWELTKSTVWLGIVAFADTFPLIVRSLVGPAIAGALIVVVNNGTVIGLSALTFFCFFGFCGAPILRRCNRSPPAL